MADRIKRLKKEDRKIPKNPLLASQSDAPRRISHGIIGVRTVRRASTKSNNSNGSSRSHGGNPFADLSPHQWSSVTVMTTQDPETGRTTHLRRKSKVRGLSRAIAQARPSLATGYSLARPKDVSVRGLLARSTSSSQNSSPAASPRSSPRMGNEWDTMPDRSPRQTFNWGNTKPSPKMAQGGWGSNDISPSQSPRQVHTWQPDPALSMRVPDLSRVQKGKVAQRVKQFSPTIPIGFNAEAPRPASQQSLEHGFVKVDDEHAIRQISNDKVDRFLASLGAPPAPVESNTRTAEQPTERHVEHTQTKDSQPQAATIVIQPPTTEPFKAAPKSASSWSTSSSPASVPAIPNKSPRRNSSKISESSISTATSGARKVSEPLGTTASFHREDRDETASLTPSDSRSESHPLDRSPTRYLLNNKAPPSPIEETFRGVKVSWLIKTYNDYMATKLVSSNRPIAGSVGESQASGLHPLLLPSAIHSSVNDDQSPASRPVIPVRRSSKVIFGPPRQSSRGASPAGSVTSVDSSSVVPNGPMEVTKPFQRPLGPARMNTGASVLSATPMVRGRSMPSSKDDSKPVAPVPEMPVRATSRPAVLTRPVVPDEPLPKSDFSDIDFPKAEPVKLVQQVDSNAPSSQLKVVPSMPVAQAASLVNAAPEAKTKVEAGLLSSALQPSHTTSPFASVQRSSKEISWPSQVPSHNGNTTTQPGRVEVTSDEQQPLQKPAVLESVPQQTKSSWRPIGQAGQLWQSHIPPVPTTTPPKALPTPPPSVSATTGPIDVHHKKSMSSSDSPRGRAEVDETESDNSPTNASLSKHMRSRSKTADRKKIVSNNVSFFDPFAADPPPMPEVQRTPLVPQTPMLERETVTKEPLLSAAQTTVTPPQPKLKPAALSPRLGQGPLFNSDSPSRTVKRIMKEALASPPPSPGVEARDAKLLAYPEPPKINSSAKQISMLGIASQADDEPPTPRTETPSRLSDSSEDDLLPKSRPISRSVGVSTKAQKLLGMSARGAAFETKQRSKLAGGHSRTSSAASPVLTQGSGLKSRASGHSSKLSGSSLLRHKSVSSNHSETSGKGPKRLVEPISESEKATSIFHDPILAPDMHTYGSPSSTPGQYPTNLGAAMVSNHSLVGNTVPKIESFGGRTRSDDSNETKPVGKRIPTGLINIKVDRHAEPQFDQVSPGWQRDSSYLDLTPTAETFERRPSSVYNVDHKGVPASPMGAAFTNTKSLHQKSSSDGVFFGQNALGLQTQVPSAKDTSHALTETTSGGMFGGFNFSQRSSKQWDEEDQAPEQQSLLSPSSAMLDNNGHGITRHARVSDASSIGTLDTKERMQKSRDSSFGSAASLPGGPPVSTLERGNQASRGRFGRLSLLEPIQQSPVVGRDTDPLRDEFNAIHSSRGSTPPTPSASDFRGLGLGLGISSHGSATALDQILHAESAARPRPQRVTTLDRINSSAQNPQAAAKISRPPIPSTAHFIPPNYPTSRAQRTASVHSSSSNLSNKSSAVPISYYQPRSEKNDSHDPFKNLDMQAMPSKTSSRRPSSVPSVSGRNSSAVKYGNAAESRHVEEKSQQRALAEKSSVDSAASSEHEYVLGSYIEVAKHTSPRDKQGYYENSPYESPIFDFAPAPPEPRQRPSPVVRSNSMKSTKKSRPATQMNSNEVHEKFDIRRALANSSEEEEDELNRERRLAEAEMQSYNYKPGDDSIIGNLGISNATAAFSKWFG